MERPLAEPCKKCARLVRPNVDSQGVARCPRCQTAVTPLFAKVETPVIIVVDRYGVGAGIRA